MRLLHSRAPLTAELVVAVLETEAAGATPPAGVALRQLLCFGYVPNHSPGVTTWSEVDRERGGVYVYIAACFLSDPGSDAPHAAAPCATSGQIVDDQPGRYLR